MNDNKKKQLNQIIILTVLLLILGIAGWNMIRSVSGSSKSTARQASTTVTGTPAQGTTTKVTPMGTVTSESNLDINKFAKEQGLIGALNPNIFTVHGISSKRNPFNRQKDWYTEEIKKIPGQSLSSEFLSEMSEEVPDLNELFNTDQEFVSYQLEKSMVEDTYSYEAKSEDGRISTSITATTKTEPTIRVEYTEQAGVGVEEITQPDAAKDGVSLPNIGSPFGSNPWQEGAAPGSVRAPRNGEKEGQFISCIGISIKGDSKSALLSMPDGPRLVREGDVLMPGNIKVVRISENGVEIRDIRTAEQVLIPLASPA